jgi:hypothetical protein
LVNNGAPPVPDDARSGKFAMHLINKPYANAFIEFARDRADVLCVSADLTSSCDD